MCISDSRELPFRAAALLLSIGWTAILAPTATGADPPITDVVFTPDGESLVTVSQAGVQVLSWPELDRKRTVTTVAANLHCLVFSPNGSQLAVGGGHPAEEGVVEVFSWPECESIATLDDHYDSVRSMVWKDDLRLLSASIDREIRLWNLENKPHSVLTLTGHSRSINAICLVDNDTTLVSSGADLSVRVWDLAAAKLIRGLNQHTKPVHALAVRPGESGLPMVASAAADRTIRFWQPTIGRMVRYVRLDAEPLDIAWLDDAHHRS